MVIAIILQEYDSVLNDDGCDQAVDGISNRAPFPPEFPINGGGQLESGAVIFKVNQPFKQPFDGCKFLFVPDSLQYFGQDKPAAADILPLPDALFQGGDFFRIHAAEKIDPDRRIDEQFHAVRVRRMDARLPFQVILPFSPRRPICFSLRTSSVSA